jgi:SNARE protein
VGTETAAALKAQVRFFSYFQKKPIVLLCCPIRKGKGNFGLFLHQTEQMSRVVNELDSIHFSIKKASQLVKEIGRQVNPSHSFFSLLVNYILIYYQLI